MEKWEQKTLTNELLQGMELAKHLQGHLITASSPETRELLLQRILTSYEKALLVLNWNGATGQTPTVGATANAPESPLSINGSPWREIFDEGPQDHQENKHVSKKRKSMPTWTDQVRVNSENGFEGSREDGYNWRKYGQKDILGAKYPRSYYRCTFQKIQKCLATKQVQRSEDDPSVFHITYRGKHTCIHANQSIPTPASPEKQDNNCNNHQLYQSQESQFNFRANLRVNTDLENKETETPFPFPSTSFGCMESEDHIFLPSVDNNNLLSCYSPSFFSPSTPETDYFSIPSCQMNYYGMDQNLRSSASDLTEIISTNTSTTSSPILNLDFLLDPVEIDPYFPFDNPGFFSQSTKFGN